MQPAIPSHDHRRAAAERSIESILDAAERLLASGAEASISAVAAAAGVSRVTLYSHFSSRPELLEAVAERVIGRAADTVAGADLSAGEPSEALDRLIDAAWGTLDRDLRLFAAGRAELSDAAIRRAHEQLDAPILALIERGQQTGAFRTDVPATWLLAAYYALMHAAAGEVTAGRLRSRDALPTVRTTIRSAFNG